QHRLVEQWTSPETFSAKLEATTTCQVRRELMNALVRFKGTVRAKEAVPAGTALFTLPVSFRPLEARRMWGMNATKATVLQLAVATTGIITTEGAEVGVNDLVHFDGITFNLG